MNNLIKNYKIILNNLKNTCDDIEIFAQVQQPKLSNIELVAINLTTEYMPFLKVKGKIRKRIETNFSQLYGQFLWAINHAKSFLGLATRLLSKIIAFTMIQYLIFFVLNKPLNKIKTNLV